MDENRQTIQPPPADDTVFWLRLTFEDLKDIKPGSKLAEKVLRDLPVYESAWREAYINAVERTVDNPALMIDEDAVISEPVVLDEADGAYVMCWQFIPHAAVIPPDPNITAKTLTKSLGRLREAAKNLEFDERQFSN